MNTAVYIRVSTEGQRTDSQEQELRRCCRQRGWKEPIFYVDKISGAKQAQRFVNELKAILGVPHCYYLISVSDDALAAYEMRGLPVRDAFDSAFDEVIHVRYLDLEGSRQLLKKRVIGMPDPFVCLCRCLSGGLPRSRPWPARRSRPPSRNSPRTCITG